MNCYSRMSSKRGNKGSEKEGYMSHPLIQQSLKFFFFFLKILRFIEDQITSQYWRQNSNPVFLWTFYFIYFIFIFIQCVFFIIWERKPFKLLSSQSLKGWKGPIVPEGRSPLISLSI